MTTNKKLSLEGKLFEAVWSRDPLGALVSIARKNTTMGEIAKQVLVAHESGQTWDNAINEVLNKKGGE